MREIFLLAGIALSPLAAYGINCVEYIRGSGAPTVIPNVTELTTSEANRLLEGMDIGGKPAKAVPSKPLLTMKDGEILATLPNEGDEPFLILGVQGPREVHRPDVREVQGFMKEAKKAKRASETEHISNSSNLLKTRSREIIYGMADAPTSIALKSNEIISAMVRLEPKKGLIVTSTLDQKVGFYANEAERQRNFRIDLYIVEPSGHAFAGFRIRGGKKTYPKVSVLDLNGNGFLLTLDDQAFHLKFDAAPKR